MPTLLEELRDRLLRAGVAPRHVARYVAELAEHFDDLLQEEKRTTADSEAAERSALQRLGSLDALTQAMVTRRELRSWSVRDRWAVFILGPMWVLLCWLVAVHAGWAFPPIDGIAAIPAAVVCIRVLINLALSAAIYRVVLAFSAARARRARSPVTHR